MQFFLRTKVSFGNGTLAKAGEEAAALGRTILVVTGRNAMRRAGLTDRLVALLEKAGVRPVLYEEASPNPATDEVDRGVELARREGVGGLVALGGGSAIDVAKAISMGVVYGKPCRELVDVPLPKPGLPLLAIPTTAGTGSEVSSAAVVTDSATGFKGALRSPWIRPVAAIVDPELTVTMPPSVTASSGADALAHAVESYLSKNATPFTELFAERAAELILAHLNQACAFGTDLAARTGMAMGSLMAGVALGQAGVVLGHGVGMALGGAFNTDHGATVGLLLPHVLEFVMPGSTSRIAQLARRARVVAAGTGDDQAAAAFVEAIRGLLAGIPLPASLSAMGCHLNDSRVVKWTMKQASTRNHPQALTEAEIEGFLRKAFGS